MPTTVNFTSLLVDLRRYLERGGSVVADETVYDQLPRLVNAAERNIMQFLKLQGEIEVLNFAFEAGECVVTKPDRWRSTVSMVYGAGTDMETRTPIFTRGLEYCETYWPDQTETAPPEFYADYDYQHWLIAPTPDAAYPGEVRCYMQPILLDDSNQTNFFTNYTPNLLLYCALLEATPFLKDDARIQVWKDMRDEQIQTLIGQDMQRILDRAAERKAP